MSQHPSREPTPSPSPNRSPALLKKGKVKKAIDYSTTFLAKKEFFYGVMAAVVVLVFVIVDYFMKDYPNYLKCIENINVTTTEEMSPFCLDAFERRRTSHFVIVELVIVALIAGCSFYVRKFTK